ncbi:MAG: hypothetical protein JXB88_06540 [Spirochaetales bacterium]|nr:hypothetical protein [Spirochaetales bacterium]
MYNDLEDGTDITPQISSSSDLGISLIDKNNIEINISTPGNYEFTIILEDQRHNRTQQTVSFTVEGPDIPSITPTPTTSTPTSMPTIEPVVIPGITIENEKAELDDYTVYIDDIDNDDDNKTGGR